VVVTVEVKIERGGGVNIRMQILELQKIAASLLILLSDASSFLHNHNSKIQELIAEKNWRELKDTLSILPAPDIANLLESLEDEWKVIIFRLLPRQLAAEVFGELDSDKRIALLQQMNDERIRDIILALSPDDRTDLFEELPGEVVQRLLTLLPPKERCETLQLLGYPEESVGRLMTPHYVAIRPKWTIERALEHIRHYGRDAETIDMVYVVDERWHLIDEIPLKRLILTDSQQNVESIMDRRFISVSVYEDQEKAAELTKRYDLVALPVVDSENVLLGIVTVDDILDVMEDEATEDIYKLAGISTINDGDINVPTLSITKRRLPWLVVCLFGGLIAAGVIVSFEEVLAAIFILAIFIPVIMDMGGNVGTQSSTVIVRGLATGEIKANTLFDVLRIFLKESKIGSAIGIFSGIVIAIVIYIAIEIRILDAEPITGMVVGIAMFATIFIAAIMGALIPIVVHKCGADPALAAGPVITTVKDVTGLLIYFGIALILMGI